MQYDCKKYYENNDTNIFWSVNTSVRFLVNKNRSVFELLLCPHDFSPLHIALPHTLSRLVTVDETWVHYYEPENKAQSRQSVGPGSPKPKKFKTQPSAGKVMATVFWDAQGVIMLGFLAEKSTITGAYYANFLE